MSLQNRSSAKESNSSKSNIVVRLWQRAISGASLAPNYHSWHAWDLCHTLATDETFQNELRLGKYCRYAVNRTGPQLFAVLQAVAEWASHCDPNAEQATTGDESEERRNALQRVILVSRGTVSWVAPKTPVDLGEWAAEQLTPSDVYGVLWLAHGIGIRESDAEGGIGKFHPRAFQCVQPILDLVHGKPSHYRFGGRIVPFSRPAKKGE